MPALPTAGLQAFVLLVSPVWPVCLAGYLLSQVSWHVWTQVKSWTPLKSAESSGVASVKEDNTPTYNSNGLQPNGI